MKIYNPEGKCIKCGNDDIHDCHQVAYENRNFYDRRIQRVYPAPDEEHISRHCKRCGYTWFEFPIDIK